MTKSTGIYTLADAARLVGTETRTIRRWVHGYSRPALGSSADNTAPKKSVPLWQTQYGSGERSNIVGFRDLLELRVVNEFVKHGVPLIVVRECLNSAKKLLGVDHPFTQSRFATDGKTIYADLLKNVTEPELVDLRKKQIVFRDIIKPSLYDGIEYDSSTRIARRWFPNKGRRIVLDPARSFGKPVLNGSGIPTEALYANYRAEGADRAAIRLVASIFDIDAKEVAAAIQFETAFAKKAA